MRIFVGLSGGVDSAVSAALLKEQGHTVVGCFIKIWQPEFIECTWREDRLDALRVAAALGIPFREIDFSYEYKKEVVETMLADYAAGQTPNPDVLCNSSIKFGHFLRWAIREGADAIATGHYARIHHNDIVHRYELLRGKDTAKDQSYFLWQLTQRELSKSLFPIGNLSKADVRKRAKKLALPNAGKPDSQGLCFVGDVSMKDFLARFIELKPGTIVDTSGRSIGTHDGAALYTTGQRHGFRIAGDASQEGSHYVINTDVVHNTLVVSVDRPDAYQRVAYVGAPNWIGEQPPQAFEAEVQVRYRETPVRAAIELASDVRVAFEHPQLVSPGQSLVMYAGEHVLGGGIVQAR